MSVPWIRDSCVHFCCLKAAIPLPEHCRDAAQEELEAARADSGAGGQAVASEKVAQLEARCAELEEQATDLMAEAEALAEEGLAKDEEIEALEGKLSHALRQAGAGGAQVSSCTGRPLQWHLLVLVLQQSRLESLKLTSTGEVVKYMPVGENLWGLLIRLHAWCSGRHHLLCAGALAGRG